MIRSPTTLARAFAGALVMALAATAPPAPARAGDHLPPQRALVAKTAARYSLDGRWQLESGSILRISELRPVKAGTGAPGGVPFMGFYVTPSAAVAAGGARAGNFSLVGHRRGRDLEGKMWLYGRQSLRCYPEGQARDFVGQIAADGASIIFHVRALIIDPRDCGIRRRETITITAHRVPETGRNSSSARSATRKKPNRNLSSRKATAKAATAGFISAVASPPSSAAN